MTGFGYGLIGSKINLSKGELSKKDLITFNVGQILTNIVAWAVVAPVLDILIYSEPANKVFAQGLVSAGFNSLAVAILGTILLVAYAKSKPKDNSLTRE